MNKNTTLELPHNTEEAYLALVKKNGLELKNIPDEMRTQTVCLAAVQQNAKALKYVRDVERSLYMCFGAVKKDAKLLKYVPDEIKTKIIQMVTVKSIIANNAFAIKYFPQDSSLSEAIKEVFASVKYIALAGPSSDAEVRDAHLTYANQKKQIASFLFNKSTTMQELMDVLNKVITGSNNNDLHFTLIGHAVDTAENLGGLHYKEIVHLCEQYPGIKHLHLIGCNVALAKKPKEEIDMVNNFIQKTTIKDKLHYGLVTTINAPYSNKDFQQKCVKFCKNNNLQGVYVLNKTEGGEYQLFSMKYNESSQTITEKIKNICKPDEIQNILENRKPIKFPFSPILLPIRQKDHFLTSKELMALRDLVYEGNRFEKTHFHYKKDKKTYPFLATIHAKLEDLESSFLKKLAYEIKKNKNITWNISIKGAPRLIHVDTAQKNFTVTTTYLYKERYNKSLFYHPEVQMIDYHKLQKERQQEIEDMRADNRNPKSLAKQLKIVITKNRTLNYWEITALGFLHAKGLTANMLLEHNESEDEFGNCHCFALRSLVLDRGYTIDAALTMIDGLSPDQIRGIENGLIREDVINLHNFWHIAALEMFKVKGLTAKMLLHRNDGGHTFGAEHCSALRNLMREDNLTIGAALATIDGLSSIQADGVGRGLTREDVINLHNVWHISALVALKMKGLTAKMLLERKENGHEFGNSHCFALRNLVLHRGLTVSAALAMIDGLSAQQVENLSNQPHEHMVNHDTIRPRIR